MLSPILSCHSIEDSISFYEKLGFTKKWAMEDEGRITFANVAFYDAEILLGVIDIVDEIDRDNLGIGIQLYIEVPQEHDIEKMYARAKEINADIVRPIEDRDWGERVFVIHDTDGYNLMFAQRPST